MVFVERSQVGSMMEITPGSKEYDRIYNMAYYAGARYMTLAHLGEVCILCGSTKDLEIDHNPKLNKKARSLTDLKDLSKIRVLCKKCNRAEGGRYGK